MLVTPVPMVAVARPVQSWNTASPILVTLLGIEIVVKLLQFLKAPALMVNTLEVGVNVTLVRLVH